MLLHWLSLPFFSVIPKMSNKLEFLYTMSILSLHTSDCGCVTNPYTHRTHSFHEGEICLLTEIKALANGRFSINPVQTGAGTNLWCATGCWWCCCVGGDGDGTDCWLTINHLDYRHLWYIQNDMYQNAMVRLLSVHEPSETCKRVRKFITGTVFLHRVTFLANGFVDFTCFSRMFGEWQWEVGNSSNFSKKIHETWISKEKNLLASLKK